MKKSVIYLFCYIFIAALGLECHVFSQKKQTRQPSLLHSQSLTGFWQMIFVENNHMVPTNYYKVFQPDSSFFSFELIPEKGNQPTAYGYYEQKKEGHILEHTEGDCRTGGKIFNAEINYKIQDNLWLDLKYRLEGNTTWNRELYVRVSRNNPEEIFEQTFNPEKQQARIRQFTNEFQTTEVIIKELIDNKQYARAEEQLTPMLKQFEVLPATIQNEISEIKGNILYNMACYRSLQGKKAEATDAFVRAAEAGFADYHHALKDSDLDSIRNEKAFKTSLQKMRETGDYGYILKQAGAYKKDQAPNLPAFTYLKPEDENLSRVRQYFNLDSIAGKGDEISRIKNLLLWVHNAVPHDGMSAWPAFRDAIDLVNVCREENRGINCRMMAIILNECYLAMGFESRFITCLPKVMISDCHVINAVYSRTLKKWLWMDPTFNAYVSDENGMLLSIAEVRERLRKDQPLVLNDDADWNHKSRQTVEEYLNNYMAKNLYYMSCHSHSYYGMESNSTKNEDDCFVSLVPEGYTPDNETEIITTDEEYFWQNPEGTY